MVGILGLILATATQAELRDPTRPPGYRNGAGSQQQAVTGDKGLRLSGIISGPGGNSAVINGRRLRPGHSVDGARVLAVTPELVKIERNGNRFTMELLPNPVKTPVARKTGVRND